MLGGVAMLWATLSAVFAVHAGVPEPVPLVPFGERQRPSLAKRLVADYGYWSKYQTPSYSAKNIPYTRLTHIIHDGLDLSDRADGSVTVPNGYVEPELIARAHQANVRVMILLNANQELFADVAGSANARQRLARDLRAFADKHGYDGVDVDWEYPQSRRQGSALALMMAQLRRQFPAPRFLLSVDAASDPRQVGGWYDFPDLLPSIDFVNDMTYDMAGPWTSSAQINSPIHRDPGNPQPQGSTQESIDLFAAGYRIPLEKINIGNPFYGYHYATVDGLYDPCRCTGQAYYVNYGTYIKQRVNAFGWFWYFDKAAGNPYLLYQGRGGVGFITYDDQISTYRRVSYSLWTRGVGGAFMWSLDADYDGRTQDLFDAMYSAYTRPLFGMDLNDFAAARLIE